MGRIEIYSHTGIPPAPRHSNIPVPYDQYCKERVLLVPSYDQYTKEKMHETFLYYLNCRKGYVTDIMEAEYVTHTTDVGALKINAEECWKDPKVPPKILATAGMDPEAQYKLGVRYLRDRSIPQNARLAVHWFRESASRGHGKAQYLMAILHRDGDGCAPSAREYVHYLKQSATKLIPEALCELAKLYHDGVLTTKNLVRARQLWRQAASIGSLEALKQLGKVDSNIIYWQKAAKLQDAEAMYTCAEETLRSGDKDRINEAFEMLRVSAQKQYPEALYWMGELYRGSMKSSEVQNCIRRDCVKASQFLSLASELLLQRSQDSKKKTEIADIKLLLFTEATESRIMECLEISRLLRAWHLFASRRRGLLMKLVTRYNRQARRQVVARWKDSVICTILHQRMTVEKPFKCGQLLQWIISAWSSYIIKQHVRHHFILTTVKKERGRKCLRKWSDVMYQMRKGIKKLCPLIHNQFIKYCARPFFDLYKEVSRLDHATYILYQVLYRKANISFYRWNRNALLLKLRSSELVWKEQNTTLDQKVHDHRLINQALDSRVQFISQRLTRERELNRTLEECARVDFGYRSEFRHDEIRDESLINVDTRERSPDPVATPPLPDEPENLREKRIARSMEKNQFREQLSTIAEGLYRNPPSSFRGQPSPHASPRQRSVSRPASRSNSPRIVKEDTRQSKRINSAAPSPKPEVAGKRKAARELKIQINDDDSSPLDQSSMSSTTDRPEKGDPMSTSSKEMHHRLSGPSTHPSSSSTTPAPHQGRLQAPRGENSNSVQKEESMHSIEESNISSITDAEYRFQKERSLSAVNRLRRQYFQGEKNLFQLETEQLEARRDAVKAEFDQERSFESEGKQSVRKDCMSPYVRSASHDLLKAQREHVEHLHSLATRSNVNLDQTILSFTPSSPPLESISRDGTLRMEDTEFRRKHPHSPSTHDRSPYPRDPSGHSDGSRDRGGNSSMEHNRRRHAGHSGILRDDRRSIDRWEPDHSPIESEHQEDLRSFDKWDMDRPASGLNVILDLDRQREMRLYDIEKNHGRSKQTWPNPKGETRSITRRQDPYFNDHSESPGKTPFAYHDVSQGSDRWHAEQSRDQSSMEIHNLDRWNLDQSRKKSRSIRNTNSHISERNIDRVSAHSNHRYRSRERNDRTLCDTDRHRVRSDFKSLYTEHPLPRMDQKRHVSPFTRAMKDHDLKETYRDRNNRGYSEMRGRSIDHSYEQYTSDAYKDSFDRSDRGRVVGNRPGSYHRSQSAPDSPNRRAVNFSPELSPHMSSLSIENYGRNDSLNQSFRSRDQKMMIEDDHHHRSMDILKEPLPKFGQRTIRSLNERRAILNAAEQLSLAGSSGPPSPDKDNINKKMLKYR